MSLCVGVHGKEACLHSYKKEFITKREIFQLFLYEKNKDLPKYYIKSRETHTPPHDTH